jgi:iron only hydrogenase large subunit-like protein
MSVFLSNLDDFIAPSQACVNPFVQQPRSDGEAGKSNTKRLQLSDDYSLTEYEAVKPDLIKTKEAKMSTTTAKVATVSLNDCLACSGCVTSAEAVLIQEQSTDKLIEKLVNIRDNNDHTKVIVCISPQSRASITSMLVKGDSSANNMTTFLKLACILKTMGVYYVFDSSSGGDLALIEAREEFLARHSTSNKCKKWDKQPCTIPVSSNKISIIETQSVGDSYFNSNSNSNLIKTVTVAAPEVNLQLPMLISQCPGWVCYAEKTSPQAIPYMSSTKSAQQIIGSVVKNVINREKNNRYYIVSVQPCFDKKLEASRLDFYDEDSQEHEVDLVISTNELWDLLVTEASTAALSDASDAGGVQGVADYMAAIPLDPPQGRDEIEAMFRSVSVDGTHFVSSADSNGGSGGYLEYLLRYSSEKLLDLPLIDSPLPYCTGRNPDISEVTLLSADKTKKLVFAKAYGFRNIQSLLLKIKKQVLTVTHLLTHSPNHLLTHSLTNSLRSVSTTLLRSWRAPVAASTAEASCAVRPRKPRRILEKESVSLSAYTTA